MNKFRKVLTGYAVLAFVAVSVMTLFPQMNVFAGGPPIVVTSGHPGSGSGCQPIAYPRDTEPVVNCRAAHLPSTGGMLCLGPQNKIAITNYFPSPTRPRVQACKIAVNSDPTGPHEICIDTNCPVDSGVGVVSNA